MCAKWGVNLADCVKVVLDTEEEVLRSYILNMRSWSLSTFWTAIALILNLFVGGGLSPRG